MFLRAFRAGSGAAGMLKTGSDKLNNGYGNGDCLLVDTGRRLFALADASERYPRASRLLLARMHACIRRDTRPLLESLQDCVREAYASQDYEHRSALVAVALTGDARRPAAVVLHGGDCTATIFRSGADMPVFRTSVNMAFAGRSRELPDARVHDLGDPPAGVVLASDGVTEIPPPEPGIAPQQNIPEQGLLCRGTAGDLPPVLARIQAANPEAYDDQSLLVIDPHRQMPPGLPPFILGGTTAAEENRYHTGDPAAADAAGWLPASQWTTCRDRLEAAGVELLIDIEDRRHDH